jgi:hypothetical protein
MFVFFHALAFALGLFGGFDGGFSHVAGPAIGASVAPADGGGSMPTDGGGSMPTQGGGG